MIHLERRTCRDQNPQAVLIRLMVTLNHERPTFQLPLPANMKNAPVLQRSCETFSDPS